MLSRQDVIRYKPLPYSIAKELLNKNKGLLSHPVNVLVPFWEGVRGAFIGSIPPSYPQD